MRCCGAAAPLPLAVAPLRPGRKPARPPRPSAPRRNSEAAAECGGRAEEHHHASIVAPASSRRASPAPRHYEAPMPEAPPPLPDGLVAVVKRECPTCQLVAPVLGEIAGRGRPLTVYTQDDPKFPATVAAPVDDHDLLVSWHHHIETVPTLLRVEGGVEVGRTEGWSRAAWEALAAIGPLGAGLPAHRPGCGSMTVDPEHADEVRARLEGH